MLNIPVLYEDNHLIVVNKPINIPVQADDSGDLDVQTALKGYIAQKYNKPGEVFLGIVHRLDRPVGGVMVFARTSKAASRLADAFRTRSIRKVYQAVVCTDSKSVPESGTLVHWLRKNNETNHVQAFEREQSGSKQAILHFAKVKHDENKNLAQIQIELETGRSHQIRVQCAASGWPLWGDHRYNFNQAKKGQQIALFSSRLEFVHPVRKEPMVFELPLPNATPWNMLD